MGDPGNHGSLFSPWGLRLSPGQGYQDPLVYAAPQDGLDSRKAEADPSAGLYLCDCVLRSFPLVWRNRECKGQTPPSQLGPWGAPSAPPVPDSLWPAALLLLVFVWDEPQHLSAAWALGLCSVSDWTKFSVQCSVLCSVSDISPTVLDALP